MRADALVLALVIACGAAAAAPTPAALAAIAEGHRPDPRAELLRVHDVSGWIAGAMLAFFEQPVPYETPSPQDRNVVGVLLLPAPGGGHRRVLVDTYGPEGANAEIVGVAIQPRAGQAGPVLAVHVAWHNAHGLLEQECRYLRPATASPPPRLVRLKSRSCRFFE